ncbi:MAG: SRPBCC family protein [Ilumatobacteraceae bacterium]|jgi:carbon monoxide dehydrogenase subunit G
MALIQVSIDIVATPERVWEVVEPVERHVDWMADAVAIRFVGSQTRGVGTAFLCDTKVGPLRLTDRMEITEWEPGKVMGVRHVGIVTGTGKFTITPTGSGTRFEWIEELIFPWWMGGPLAGIVGGQLVMKAIWRRNLRELKKIVEAR